MVGIDRRMMRAVLLSTCAVLIGCSRGPEPAENIAGNSATLSSPTQLVISVPNPLSPIAPVLGATGSLALGATDDIVGTTTSLGGGFSTQPDAIVTGDAWSLAQATIADRTNIHGVLHASSVSLGNQVQLGGRDATPRFDPNSTLSWAVQFPSGTGPSFTLNSGDSRTLAPGLYGSIIVNSGASLSLQSGTYYISGFQVVNSASTVFLQQGKGPVIIYVSNPPVLNGAFTAQGGLLGDGGAPTQPDLLIAYLGTSQVNVNSTYSGALIAPLGSLNLNPVSQPYVGFFYARSLTVQATTTVKYAVPTALVTAARPSGPTCLKLLKGLVPPSVLPVYCPSSRTPDDTDGDGVPDGLDQCPYDPKKTLAGVCGCGTPDTDTLGNGIPDCIRVCNHDPKNIYPGQCGCVGQANLKPAGTFCSDTACPPQAGATCDGAGVCGNRSACQPNPGCIFVANAGRSYWICAEQLPTVTESDGGLVSVGNPAGGLSWAAAQAACSAKGLTLLQINNIDQNRFISQFLTTPVWLGANDQTTSGVWDWAAPGNVNGNQFWSGTGSGTPVNAAFSYWQPGAPGSNRCGLLQPSGYWLDVNCSDSFGYVCVYDPPPVQNGVIGPAGQPGPAADLGNQCVNELSVDAGGLPSTFAELQREVDASFADVFIGAAANPPARNSTQTCPDDLDAASQNLGTGPDAGACWFVGNPLQVTHVIQSAGPNGGSLTLQTDCITDQECLSQFGAGFYCRQIKDPSCVPPEAGSAPTQFDQDAACAGGARCVQMQCPSAGGGPCQEVQICVNPDASFDASPDPATNLDAGAFNLTQIFEGGVPDGASAGAYYDPVDGATGPAHPWCHMQPQNPVRPATQPNQNTSGSSGAHSLISFSFDPNLEFTANANPAAFGQGGLSVHGGATLKAAVSLHNFFGQNYSTDIVDIGTGIDATQCNVNNNKTQFTVLGIDVISLAGLGVPQFDSAQLAPNLTRDCNDAIANFALWANRVKKAFRDAQQLLSQYQNITSNGGQLADTLCQDIIGPIAANGIANFPGGLHCPTAEPVEITINRFVDYLQAPGIGEVSQLRGSAMQLTNKAQGIIDSVLAPLKRSEQFLNITADESQTVLSVPFAIGPVPMLLQVDVFASYGIAGNFNLTFNVPLNKLFGLDDTSQVANPNSGSPGTQIPVAHAGVQVLPYAGAGLSAFVGAGFDFAVLAASVGIEGAVTLGDVAAPVYAGAGVDLMAQYDPRPIPADIAPVSVADLSSVNPVGSLFQFALPKSFQFFVWFDYGAGIELDNVLSGDINVRLRIKFFFFSRTWRKTLVRFHGWSKHFDLISGAFGPGAGGSRGVAFNNAGPVLSNGHQQQRTTEVTGTPTMGLSEQQFPLTVLVSLSLPDGGIVGDAGPDGGDAGALFGQTIPFDASAVQGFFYDDLCCIKQEGQACSLVGTPECCPDFACVLGNPKDRDSGTCQRQCVADGGACRSGTGSSCCGTLTCQGGVCAPPPPPPTCNGLNGPCGPTQPCCGGLDCIAGVCINNN